MSSGPCDENGILYNIPNDRNMDDLRKLYSEMQRTRAMYDALLGEMFEAVGQYRDYENNDEIRNQTRISIFQCKVGEYVRSDSFGRKLYRRVK